MVTEQILKAALAQAEEHIKKQQEQVQQMQPLLYIKIQFDLRARGLLCSL
jgi:hypothetical protein